jgi:sarcosine oxidase
LHFEEEVLHWEPVQDRGRVRTAQGAYEAGRLVIAPGAWASEVLADLNLPLEVERQIMFWFDPVGGIAPFLPERFPIFVWEADDGATPYGLPAIDGPRGGVKVAFYRSPRPSLCTPRTIDRSVHEFEVEQMRSAIADRIPSLNGGFLRAVTCMYTNTPDKNFVLTIHPRHPQVAIACGFSGHGFKFCSVVGEILADLVIKGATRHDIKLFDPQRLREQGRPNLPARTQVVFVGRCG